MLLIFYVLKNIQIDKRPAEEGARVQKFFGYDTYTYLQEIAHLQHIKTSAGFYELRREITIFLRGQKRVQHLPQMQIC